MKQGKDNTYSFETYCTLNRWSSYWYQIREVLGKEPGNVLEIGVGVKLLANYLSRTADIQYHSFDIIADLKPDIVGSVDCIPCKENKYDVVCAFQVLEHLPFEKFQRCLLELHRVSRKSVIISLPHWGPDISFQFKVPLMKKAAFSHKFDFVSVKHKFENGHYWEIGKKGYPLKRIIKEMRDAQFLIEKDFIVKEFPYHHFFILEKN